MVQLRLTKLFWQLRVQLSVIFLAIVTVLAFIPVFTYLYFARDLNSKESIMNRNNTGLILLDRKDRPFFTFYEAKYKEFIPLSKIPKHTQQAVIAIEDKEFYEHPGFSVRGIARSVFLDLKEKEIAYGGSTITQQLVKNVLLHSRKSFLRKYQEIVLAQEIERRYSKNEILEMYLNSVYFGEGSFGIEQAAGTYFGKKATDLTLAESAMLAGILPAPSEFSPLSGNDTSAKTRQRIVLTSMFQQKYISEQEKRAAEKSALRYIKEEEEINTVGAHFAILVRKELIDEYGEEHISRSGFRVKTSLDLDLQEYAEGVVAQQVQKLASNNVSNGAAVVMDTKTGEVLALVGSKDWYNSEYGKLNVAADSNRSPGSAFKPIIYAAALEKKIITPASVLHDRPTTFQGNYKPQNYDRRFRGSVLVRRALANSLNVPAVEVMQKVGVSDGLEFGKRLGLTTLKDPSNYGLSLVLGTAEVSLLELTNAYATFANNGIKNDIATIISITDKREKEIFHLEPEKEQVLDSTVAFLISSILSDNRARAEVFGSALTVSRPAAVKTGTAEDYEDALTIGYTPSIAVGVWVGNNDGKAMDRIAGSLGAAPIWRLLIEEASADTPVERFTPPSGVTSRSICGFNGLIVRNATSSALLEYFISGTEPTRYCTFQRQIAPTTVDMSITPSEERKEEENKEKEEREKKEKDDEDKKKQQELQQEFEEQLKEQLEQIQPTQASGAGQ